jgi:hypothetical protein
MMHEATRVKALRILGELEEQIKSAERMLLAGEDLSAIRILLAARRMGGEASASLIGDCLRTASWKVVQGDLQDRLRGKESFARMIEFALLALCSECRQQIGVYLKKERESDV